MSGIQSVEDAPLVTKNWLLRKALDLMAEMEREGRELEMVWVPSHCGLEGNEWADEAAKRGTMMEPEKELRLYEVARARVRRMVGKKREWKHERSKAIYGKKGVRVENESELTRERAVRLRRFRTGHSLDLREYR
jgi:hypothetical protein